MIYAIHKYQYDDEIGTYVDDLTYCLSYLEGYGKGTRKVDDKCMEFGYNVTR